MPTSSPSVTSFLFVNGLAVPRPVALGPNVEIVPACCRPHHEDILHLLESDIDQAIASIFLARISSQIRVNASDAMKLAVLAWNTLWDITLLNAVFNADAISILESNSPAESFGSSSSLHVMHHHLDSLGALNVHTLTELDAQWLEKHFASARQLLDEPSFMNAAHAMASYHWHPHPRAKLAILWSGIEGLFGVESELSFRIGLYCARFLAPDSEERRRSIFSSVKGLYKVRSSAVHGAELGKQFDIAIAKSASLLQDLIKRCIELNQIPKPNNLAP